MCKARVGTQWDIVGERCSLTCKDRMKACKCITVRALHPGFPVITQLVWKQSRTEAAVCRDQRTPFMLW